MHGTAAVQRSVLVRVVADSGAEGWATSIRPGLHADVGGGGPRHRRRPGAAPPGADPFNLHQALATMDRAAERFEAGRRSRWRCDLKGRAVGLPVTAPATGPRPRHAERVDRHVAAGARRARRARVARPRVHHREDQVSGPGPEGIERVAAVRAAVGARMELRVDFNESLRAARRSA